MKYNVTINEENLNGYVNLTPIHGVDLFNPPIEPGIATEIILNILDFIPATLLHSVLKQYINKLRHGGKIIIQGTSASIVFKNFINDNSSLKDLNIKIYGEGKHPWDIHRGIFDIDLIKQIFQVEKLKIEQQSIVGDQFVISGVRL